MLCHAGKVTKQLSDITISNGIGWSPDNRTMYYIDSTPKKVYAFDFDESEATISNQRVLVDYSQVRQCVIRTQPHFWASLNRA